MISAANQLVHRTYLKWLRRADIGAHTATKLAATEAAFTAGWTAAMELALAKINEEVSK